VNKVLRMNSSHALSAASFLGLTLLAGWLVVVLPHRIIGAVNAMVEKHQVGLILGVALGAATLALAVRSLGRDATAPLTPRLVIYGYLTLLFFGFAALDAVRLLKAAAWPIAATSPLPTDQDARRALWLGIAGAFLIVMGVTISGRLARGRGLGRNATAEEWDVLQLAAPLFAAAGLFGAAIIYMKTHQLAVFSRNIDQFRFSQGSGLGYAAMLEYELLLAACLSGAVCVARPRSRRFNALVFAACLVALVALRAERTPLILAVGSTYLVYAFGGGKHRRRIALLLLPMMALIVIFLGLIRLESNVGPLGRERAVVRSVFDISPEFRESAFAYRIYPTNAPFIRSRALAADVSSILPNAFLRVIGVNKESVYGDVSHEYSATMTSLGIYPRVKPLRIGLGAEMWADAGGAGFVFGLLGYGLLVGLCGKSATRGAIGIVRKSIGTMLLLLALITPIGSLLPTALMLLAPLFVVRLLSLNGGRTQPPQPAEAAG
jgi:hypothetical protein